MKNIVRTLGLAALIGISAGCSEERESKIIRNPVFDNIFNDGTLAVYENKNGGIERPSAFVYAKNLKFEYRRPVHPTYPAAGRVELPYLKLEGNGKGTLYLKNSQGLVVSDLQIKE